MAKRARQKPPFFRERVADDWEHFVDEIKVERHLDERRYRMRVKRLALDLESEGNAAHRAADLWDLLSDYSRLDRKRVRPSDYSRSAVLRRLKANKDDAKGYTDEELAVAAWELGRLAQTDLDDPGSRPRRSSAASSWPPVVQPPCHAHPRRSAQLSTEPACVSASLGGVLF